MRPLPQPDPGLLLVGEVAQQRRRYLATKNKLATASTPSLSSEVPHRVVGTESATYDAEVIVAHRVDLTPHYEAFWTNVPTTRSESYFPTQTVPIHSRWSDSESEWSQVDHDRGCNLGSRWSEYSIDPPNLTLMNGDEDESDGTCSQDGVFFKSEKTVKPLVEVDGPKRVASDSPLSIAGDLFHLPSRCVLGKALNALPASSRIPFYRSKQELIRAYGYSSAIVLLACNSASRRVLSADKPHSRHRIPSRFTLWRLKTLLTVRRRVGGMVTGVPPHLYA